MTHHQFSHNHPVLIFTNLQFYELVPYQGDISHVVKNNPCRCHCGGHKNEPMTNTVTWFTHRLNALLVNVLTDQAGKSH